MSQYVIVGTGVAGLAAAESIRSVDKQSTITLIGDDPHGYYSRPGLAYFLTGETDQAMLFPFQPKEFEALQARFVRGTVSRVHPDQHRIEMSDGKMVPYDRLLLAMGSTAVRLNVPGAQLEGVVKLDHMDDARQIVSLTRRTRSAVVVGGGITALELAEGLSARKVKVNFLIRSDRYWGNVLDQLESTIVEHKLKEHGMNLHYKSDLAEVLGKGGRVCGVKLVSGQEIKCEMVAYGIGVRPRMNLALEAGVACDRGILVNEYLQTNVLDIFAAGDVAQVFDPASGRSLLDSLWAPARDQGRAAGLNMTGKPTVYVKKVPFNVTRLAGLTTTIIGVVGPGKDVESYAIARGDSETWQVIPDAIIAQADFDVNHLRLMVGKKTIVGAIVMGDQKLSSPLQVLIREEVDISSIRDQLISPNAPLSDIVAKFWSQVYASRN